MKGNQWWINPPYFWGVGTLAMIQRTPKDWWVCWLAASAYLKRNSPLTPSRKIPSSKLTHPIQRAALFWVDDFPFPVVGINVRFLAGSFILNPQKMEVFCVLIFRSFDEGVILRLLWTTVHFQGRGAPCKIGKNPNRFVFQASFFRSCSW